MSQECDNDKKEVYFMHITFIVIVEPTKKPFEKLTINRNECDENKQPQTDQNY